MSIARYNVCKSLNCDEVGVGSIVSSSSFNEFSLLSDFSG